MKVGNSLQKVLNDLEEMGVSERKVINYLKRFRDEIKIKNNKTKKENIIFNSKINDLLFNGRFDIYNPTNELLMYINNIRKEKGGKFVYYCLVRILDDYYYKNNNIHNMSDDEKCRFIMYFLKLNNELYVKDYIEINTSYYDENLTGDDFIGYEED